MDVVDSSSWRALVHFVDEWREISNLTLDHLEPWQIVFYTLSVVFFIQWARKITKYEENLSFMWLLNDILIYLPGMQKKIEGFKEASRKEIEEKLLRFDRKKEFYRFLPDRGLSTEEIVGEAAEYKIMGDALFSRGLLSGASLSDNDENYQRMAQKIFDMYNSVNAIYPDVFPGCRKMEAEGCFFHFHKKPIICLVIRMLAQLYHGGSKSCGSITISGTESILLACIAYRNRAFKLGLRKPEIVIPKNAHIGFAKAAKLLDIRVVRVPLSKNFEVNVSAMKRAISRETCMLVASMPSYVYGTMDNIDKISQLGIRYGVPVHVDACLGGFLMPFMEHCDFPVSEFDFRLSGVTSISVDLDKYAYCPTGSSAILYRDEEFFHFQCYTEPRWAGGVYVSPTLSGNRPGSMIALTWATLLFNGRLGYIEKTHRIIDAARLLREKIQDQIDDIEILGEPALSIITFTSRNLKIPIHIVGDEMNEL
uniref:sphinganine-1-phosphate aldolase n=1 Tax=Acrobeloides nanus TaxID=290746 RepID=A0A914CV29_9BILA